MHIEHDNELAAFYTNHLRTVVLPFWLHRAIDHEHGGYLTCFDNRGERLLSEDKYTWSQGRMVWVLAKLAGMKAFSAEERRRFIQLAGQGATFLMEHCLLENGNCTFLMDREGLPKPQVPGHPCDTSIFADCFVIMGLARYAQARVDAGALAFARQLYHSVLRRLGEGTYRTEPYPTPPGYRAHAIPMIMLNVSQEIAGALDACGDREGEQVVERADAYVQDIMNHFVVKDVLHEMITTEDRLDPDTILGRYVNPGHTLEDMWFVLHQAMHRDDWDIIARVARVVTKTLEIGWDEKYGGLLLFVDQEGGHPHGSIVGLEGQPMVGKILNDWDNKLWWPHSEALYATLLAARLTGDERLRQWHRKIHEYTFATFPNPDRAIGEWIQIRDRKGVPEQKVVALPVKDPYHIIRNLALIVELLRENSRSGSGKAPEFADSGIP